MSAFNQPKPGESWEAFAARSQAECQRSMFSGLTAQDQRIGNGLWSAGECQGCGAIWRLHAAQNALAASANECSYCRRPIR